MGSGRAAIWFSATAFLISILSFVAATAQTWLTYEHNRLSVMPKLDWRTVYGDDKGQRLDIILINAGLGPAKVSNLKISVNEKIVPMEGARACTTLDDLLEADSLNSTQAKCFSVDVDDWVFLKPDEKLVLYSTGASSDEIDTDIIESIGVTARYCSLYDQCEEL